MQPRVITTCSDHAGFLLKRYLHERLAERGFQVVDLGTETDEPVDYPDYAYALASRLRHGPNLVGLAVCGSGIGVSIALNRFPWVRAALCHDATAARLAREHNDANVLVLGGLAIDRDAAMACLTTFLQTGFSGGRHARRVGKLGNPPRLCDTPTADCTARPEC